MKSTSKTHATENILYLANLYWIQLSAILPACFQNIQNEVLATAAPSTKPASTSVG